MRKFGTSRFTAMIILAGLAAAVAPALHAAQQPPDVGIVLLDRDVADHDWSADGKWVVYSKRNAKDSLFDIWLIKPDGSGKLNLSEAKNSALPAGNCGCVVWHPSGDYFVFTAQNPDATGAKANRMAEPGVGLNCNLWAANRAADKAWKLTALTSSMFPHGVNHPQFSPDGKKLCWAEALGKYSWSTGMEWGQWAVMTADFAVEKGVPSITNPRKYTPGKQKCYFETHHFSRDGSKVLFSGNLEDGQVTTGLDIHELDLATGNATRLTKTLADWDEHSHLSPDGKTIAWMSSAGLGVKFESSKFPEWMKYLKSELWLMNADGSNQRRITFFNQPGHPDREWFIKTVADSPRVAVSDISYSKTGTTLALTLAYEGAAGAVGTAMVLLDVSKRR